MGAKLSVYRFSSRPTINFTFSFTNNHSQHQQFVKSFGKLQITPLKFRGDWILYLEVLEFRFYHLKFGDIWILDLDILEFGFYPLYFMSVWILLPKVLECLDFTP